MPGHIWARHLEDVRAWWIHVWVLRGQAKTTHADLNYLESENGTWKYISYYFIPSPHCL